MIDFPISLKPPVPNSSDNATCCDVIGNKGDEHVGDSIYANLKTVLEHIHKASRVYPTLSDGVTVLSGPSSWQLGDPVEVVPVNTITSDFDIHYVSVEDISANDVYELVLYADPTGVGSKTEIGRVRFVRSAVQSATLNVPMMTPLIAANSQIVAKIACADGAYEADITLFYHTY